jgi:DHA1 family tetracycline resistance protein-like MFS transporter
MNAVSTSAKTNFLSLLPLLMVVLIDVMGLVLVFPVLAPLFLHADSTLVPAGTSVMWRDFLYGFTVSIFPFFMFFSTPVLGDLSDKFGRKKILLWCLLACAASYIVSALGIYFHDLFTFLAGRGIAGLAAGTQPIAAAAIIDLSNEHTKTKNLSWVVLVSSVGLILGPLLSGVTADVNYQLPFYIAAVLSFLNAVLLFYTYQEKQSRASSHKIQILKGFTLFIAAFSQKKFSLLSSVCFCLILAWSLYFQVIGWFFMEEFHYNVNQLGLFIGYIGVIFVFTTSVLLNHLLKIFADAAQACLFFILLMGVTTIACTLTQSAFSQWIWVIFISGSEIICYTLFMDLFSDLANKDAQGWIMGVMGSVMAITWTVGGLIAGPLGYVNIRVPFWTAGALCFVSFILLAIYRKSHQQ